MLDASKRRTMQLMGTAPLLTLPVVSAISGVASASDTVENGSVAGLPPAAPKSGLPVEIQIISTSSVPDNNVLIRNTSDDELLITRFTPGHVYYNGEILDLNESIKAKPIHIQAEQSIALHYRSWPVVNAGPVEYLLADQSVQHLSNETAVITLGAFMANTDAVLYANTQASLPNKMPGKHDA